MKRIIAIVLVFVTAFIIYAVYGLIPNIYLSMGKKDYDQKEYQKAYPLLKTAVHLRGQDRDARYYFVQTLLKLSPTLEVQKELYNVSQVNMPDSADLIADRQIAIWRNQISLRSGENYIEQVPFNDKILRWDATKFPLKVYIEPSSGVSVPDYYDTEIKKAFLQWQSSTGGFINFKFMDDTVGKTGETPDILVKIVPQENNKCTQTNCKYIVANTTPTIKGDRLKQMDIVFFDSNNLGKPFGAREIYNTALHEIGHSLGIMGHSYNKDDLMYMENNLSKDAGQFRSDYQLIAPTDLNTLKLLYRLIPDITNTDLAHFDTSRQFFAPIVMGTNEQINSRKLLEAKNYIEAAPNLPNGYIDLAAAYAEQKEYNSAIEALQQALNLSSNDAEKFIVYYNFAVTYMNVQDWDNSLKYADLAKQIQPTNSDIDGLIAAINYNKGNRAFAKEAYAAALEKNPSSVIDAVNLARIYLKEFNLVDAGKILNNLVKANPDAKNDPKVRQFGLLMFFFR